MNIRGDFQRLEEKPKHQLFYYGKQSHLKMGCKQGFLGKMNVSFFLEIIQIKGPLPLKYAEGMEKADIGLMNVDQQETERINA